MAESDRPMYERFTDRARKVMQLANQEAQRFNHEYIGTEHILLGLVKEGTGVAANVLKNLDIDLRKIRLEVEKIVQAGPDMVTMGKLPRTPRAKKVIEYSIEEARNLNQLSIYRFKVEPDVLPGEYRYRLLILTPSARRDRDFNGRLELVVNLTEGGQSAMMSFPEQAEAGAAAFKLNFRYFRRVEGTFRVSPKAKVESVQARIYESGTSEPRATNSVSL